MAVVAFHSRLSETEIYRLHLVLLLRSPLLFIFTAPKFVLLTFCSWSYFVRNYKVRTTRAANVLAIQENNVQCCYFTILPKCCTLCWLIKRISFKRKEKYACILVVKHLRTVKWTVLHMKTIFSRLTVLCFHLKMVIIYTLRRAGMLLSWFLQFFNKICFLHLL